MLSSTGGHADGVMPSGGDIHWFAPYPGRPDFICDGVEGARQKVREVLRAGADAIKICSMGGVSSPNDHPFDESYSPEELKVFVDFGSFVAKLLGSSSSTLTVVSIVDCIWPLYFLR